MLAHAVAEGLGRPLLTWHVKSSTVAQEGLYHYDVVQRLNDARFADIDGIDVSDIRRYIRMGVLGQAFRADKPVVLLIDEIDKADVEFPNDLLRELDEMAFHIPELDETVRAEIRPVTIITSNAEKELPDAFLRRCVFHYIRFPEPERVRRIVSRAGGRTRQRCNRAVLWAASHRGHAKEAVDERAARLVDGAVPKRCRRPGHPQEDALPVPRSRARP